MDLELWKRLKKEQRLTFDELSERSKIPKRTLEDIFAGRTTDPRTTTVEAIERALGINEKSSPAEQESKGIVIPEKYKDVAVAFHGGADDLTQEDIDSIVEFIEFKKNQKKK